MFTISVQYKGCYRPKQETFQVISPTPPLHHLLEKQTSVYTYQLPTFQCLGQKVVQKKSPI